MLKIQDLKETRKLDRDAMQTVQGGRDLTIARSLTAKNASTAYQSWVTYMYANVWN